MPKWLKIVLLVGLIGFVGFGLLVGGIVWWATANKDQIVSDTKAAQEQGTVFGATHHRADCIDDSVVRK